MKSIKLIICCCAVLGSQATAQQTATKGGQLTESEIQESRIYRRAGVEAAIWSQPLMGTNQTRSAVRAAGGDCPEYFDDVHNSKAQTLPSSI